VADRGLTGVLLVGGASRRFGAPKALARLDGETLAERAWRLLGEACDERIALGKAGEFELPFDVRDDGISVRAPIAGVVAGLRAAAHETAVFLPVDVPFATPELLCRLGDACAEAACTQTGPLPAAFAKRALPALERRLERGELALKDALAELETAIVEADPAELRNVNRPEELAQAATSTRSRSAPVPMIPASSPRSRSTNST
jgi:molybdopterin-guanine dinucleotide biosynthesis protein A